MVFRKGFTLAEVLITLGIIGVVAALTIPTLVQTSQESGTVSSVKKAYSVLSSAYTSAVQENGTPDSWDLIAGDGTPMLKILKPYLKIVKDCTDGSTGCFVPELMYKNLSGADASWYDWWGTDPRVILADGSAVMGTTFGGCTTWVGTSVALKQVCGSYWVDVNGYKGPNQWGRDLFGFWLTKDAIIPYGTTAESWYPFATNCSNRGTADGFGCAAWLIFNSNVDYLHCTGLGWGTKTTCK